MKKFITLAFLCLSVQIFAQSKENERFALGFFTGFETQSLGIEPLDSRKPELSAVVPGRPSVGVSVGVFGRKKLWRGLYFQPELMVSYLQNTIIFRDNGPLRYRFLDADLPLHFVVADRRRGDFPLRGCIIFGTRTGWNFSQNNNNLLKIKHERVALDLGLGAEIRVGQWRLQPTFVYSHGLNNLHDFGNAQYDWVVGKMVRDRLSLRLSVWRVKKQAGI